MPPLRKSQGLEGPRKSRPSREDELTEDGFLDLDGSEEAEEGFLLRDEAIHDGEALAGGSLIEEDSLLDEDDIEEDDEEYEEASGDVIDQYLGGMPFVSLTWTQITLKCDLRSRLMHKNA